MVRAFSIPWERALGQDATEIDFAALHTALQEESPMNGVIYLVGLIVVVMFVLSLIGLR
jgi:hypothetical protein